MLGYYAEDARLSIINSEGQRSIAFELRGREESAKHLRAAFDRRTSHRVERGVVDEYRVTFRETRDYPDGGRVVVETTLRVRDRKIVRQVDIVANRLPDRMLSAIIATVRSICNDKVHQGRQPRQNRLAQVTDEPRAFL